MIQKKTEIEINDNTRVFAFVDKIVLFSPERDDLKIFDSTLILISTVVFRAPLLSIAPAYDVRIFECIDAFNNKFPFPLLEKSHILMPIKE